MARVPSVDLPASDFGCGSKSMARSTGTSRNGRAPTAEKSTCVNARAVRGTDREIVCYEGTLEDISDRRAAEKQIRTERDFSSAVIDTAGSLVLILDREGCIVRINQACETLTGKSLHDVAGQPIWEALSSPEDSARIRKHYRRVLGG